MPEIYCNVLNIFIIILFFNYGGTGTIGVLSVSSSQWFELQERLSAIEALRVLKKRHTYEDLSRMLNLPVSVLNRYVMGRVVPRIDRARKILKFFEERFDLAKEIKNRIKFDKTGYFDNTPIVFDIPMLKLIVKNVIGKYVNKRVSKILTASTDGIPIAALFASELGVDLVYAKKEKEVGIPEFLEESYIPSSSGVYVSLYLPKRAIASSDRVLIVDDIIRSGETQRALVNLVKKAGAKLVGIFILIAVGNLWKNYIAIQKNVPMDIFVQIKPPT